ncbi:MAG: hypothetical protein H0X53_08385, partial [Sphingomonas sp.]|nr:hypothetical protein [Sphingomonas sp.]
RLGITQDLKITGTLFDSFQALDRETAVRLISSDPPSLARFFSPIFSKELLDSAQILGLSLTLQNPVRGRLLLKMKTPKNAEDLARKVRDDPQHWLRIAESDALLYAQAPEVITAGADLEIRFPVPTDSARLLLQRVAKSNAPPALAGN